MYTAFSRIMSFYLYFILLLLIRVKSSLKMLFWNYYSKLILNSIEMYTIRVVIVVINKLNIIIIKTSFSCFRMTISQNESFSASLYVQAAEICQKPKLCLTRKTKSIKDWHGEKRGVKVYFVFPTTRDEIFSSKSGSLSLQNVDK